MKLIDKDASVAEIERRRDRITKGIFSIPLTGSDRAYATFEYEILGKIKDFLDSLEVKEVNLENNGWIDCIKQMPPETKQTSDTLQGHREWTESELVLVWDSVYGVSVDSTRNGKWRSEQKGGYTGQIIHGIIAWRPIPEFSEELLLKAQKGEEV